MISPPLAAIPLPDRLEFSRDLSLILYSTEPRRSGGVDARMFRNPSIYPSSCLVSPTYSYTLAAIPSSPPAKNLAIQLPKRVPFSFTQA